jgi:transposase
MDIKQQAIHEYLHEGVGYRTLAKKYGVSRTTINKWVMIHPNWRSFAAKLYGGGTSASIKFLQNQFYIKITFSSGIINR